MNFLVINLGLRSIRAIVFNEKGEKLTHTWYPVKTIIQGDRVEQDPNEWWKLCQEVIREIVVDQAVKRDIRTISVTSSACCLVLMDEGGNAIGHSLMVSDKRSQLQAEKIKTEKKLADIFLTPNNLAAASFMMPKMSWIRENEPDNFKKAKKFISSNDFLLYKLTGQYVTDPLNAEKFYYDQEKGEYPESMLKFLGITDQNLPEVVPIGNYIGELTHDLRQRWGIDHKVDVIITTYDAICAFWGAGVHDEGHACNVCGTVTSFRVYSAKKSEARHGILSQRFRHGDDVYIVGGSNNLDGGLLEWARDVFYGDAYPEKYIFNIMEDEATQSTHGAHGLVFLPYLLGERVPFFDTKVRGMFFGLERHHSRKDLIRSIFESSGFLAMSIMEAIESLGVPVDHIRLSGGLARNNLISQIRADITGKNILLVEETETTALGAFMIMAIAEGIFDSFKSASQIVKIKKSFFPDPEAHKKYQHVYDFFKELYKDTNKSFIKRSDAFSKMQTGDTQHIIRNL